MEGRGSNLETWLLPFRFRGRVEGAPTRAKGSAVTPHEAAEKLKASPLTRTQQAYLLMLRFPALERDEAMELLDFPHANDHGHMFGITSFDASRGYQRR